MSKNRTPDPTVIVSAKAEKSLARRHPWIFSGAVRRADEQITPGSTVMVQSADGRRLAAGAWSPQSQIRVRIWTFDPDEAVDTRFFERKIAAALQARTGMPLLSPCTALRLVNAESDGLPGLIVDRYGDFLVCQFLTTGVVLWKQTIVDILQKMVAVQGIYERSDTDARKKEGLPYETGLLWGQMPPELIQIQCGEVRLWVDVVKGHKTGLYLDQRENQARIADFARDARVLNCFSYTGGFGLWALKAGARHVTQIDASADILTLARKNLSLNGLTEAPVAWVTGNVFDVLRRFRDSRQQFDLIVLDPPKFVASAGQLNKGSRGYKDINLLGFKLLRPGGVLMTFSCSGQVAPSLFQKIVADAATDAQRTTRIIGHMHQAPDHPIALNFPEGHYLKGLICMVS